MKKTGFTGFENFLRTFGAGLACLLAMAKQAKKAIGTNNSR